MKLPRILVIFIFMKALIITHYQVVEVEGQSTDTETSTEPPSNNNEELTEKAEPPPPLKPPPPNPITTASYLSLDGLTLVIMFDKPVDLDSTASSSAQINSRSSERITGNSLARLEPAFGRLVTSRWPTCFANPSRSHPFSTNQLQQQNGIVSSVGGPIQGIHLCAKLLTKKTLKLLHKYRLHNCIWPTKTQLLIQLAKPAASSASPLRVTFQRGTLSEYREDGDESASDSNEREVSLELQRLPLEALGVPLAPRIALTGPNQVPPCGQFSLSAHLSSPYGTRAGESVRLNWSVERVGFGPVAAGNGSQLLRANTQQQAASELQWASLRELVSANKANNLLLDSRLLQSAPQRYEFQVSATFATSMATITLNASHQVSRLDFDAPIGTVYGSHLLAQQPFTNPGQDLLLLADIQVPECTRDVKQVGLYWQVSDPRVRFEQTYAPYYLARSNSLPEQSTIEFRMNVFYGIRVKKYASSGSLVLTGDSVLEAQISGGALVVAVGREDEITEGSNESGSQLELFAGTEMAPTTNDLFTYQWSCFDGKTAQPCARNPKTIPQQLLNAQQQATGVGQPTTNSTPRYEIGSFTNSLEGLRPLPAQSSGSLPLIEPKRQRQQVLRLPKSWLEPEAQLWFGLQRFDRQNPSHKSQSEYALISVHQGPSPTLTIGPVLVGRSRHRATVRNPLTGAVILVAGAPAIVVGRIAGSGPWPNELSFAWRLANQITNLALKWNLRNVTNPLSGQPELVTELHLNQRLQVAHAHYQLQLVACNSAGQTVAATLNIDVVPGVSQCRVGAGLSPESLGRALVVAVEHCNIPLGLSPLTYQLYMADAMEPVGSLGSGSDNEGANTNGNENNGVNDNDDDDDDPDYVTNADELVLLARAQPLTTPQLSPVFSLAGFGPEQLLAMIGGGDSFISRSSNSSSSGGRPRRRALRFGARVCDQLKSCRMFFSAPFGPTQMFSGGGGGSDADQINKQALSAAESTLRGPQMIKSIGTMVEGARRANLAGNSIAAIAILNGAMNLGQKLTVAAANNNNNNKQQQQQQDSSVASGSGTGSGIGSGSMEDRIRDLVQVAARDCLSYGVQSMKRQFHYTESGQTNLVMHSMGRILSLPHGNIELKFRAIRLITQLTQRTINDQLNLKLNCLADFKSIQWFFETLFGTFSHYSVERSPNSIDKHNKLISNSNKNKNNRSPSNSLSLSISNSSTTNNVPLEKHQQQQQSQSQNQQQFPTLTSATTTTIPNITPTTTNNNNNNNNNNHNHNNNSNSSANNRKRREEAILAYLRSVRLAYRALISAAAIQLPLGDAQQFHYPAGGISANLYNNISPSRSRTSTATAAATTTILQQTTPTGVEPSSLSINSMQPSSSSFAKSATTTTTSASTLPPPPLPTNAARVAAAVGAIVSSDIVSSLIHLTEITDSPIPIDLPSEFGSISLQLDRRLSLRLRQLIEGDKLICRNGTTSKCSTFVLSISWFAGKAPFRSLDDGPLRVPIFEFNLLSPLDGSNLMDLIDWGDEIASNELSSSVTFAVPKDLDGSEQNSNNKYKCYKFDEDSNEWARIQQVNVEPLDIGSSMPLNSLELIKCRFKGSGAIGAFKGRPSLGEGSVGHSVALFVLGAVGIVILLSLLSCLASSSSRSGSSVRSSDGEDDSSDRKLGGRRHPEENTTTYRNDYNYPL